MEAFKQSSFPTPGQDYLELFAIEVMLEPARSGHTAWLNGGFQITLCS